MGILTVACDYPNCDKVLSINEANNHCGEGYFCDKHSIELEIKDLDRTVKHKLDWLKNTHLAEIKKLRAKRRVLQKELSELG